MELFEYILILLCAIFLSNFLNRLLPKISVPIIQIILGAIISLLLNFSLRLDPNLFFVLFIAPLIFNSSMLIDKKTFWKLKKPILNMSIFLVIGTVIVMGWFVNWLIPIIPLAAAFALIAALTPTDAVAVDSIAKRLHVPNKIMSILEGESIINDFSSIVCFQFALAAVLTGTFSLQQAIVKLVVLGLGGILVGLIFTGIKYVFIKWIRLLGMENITLHILVDILTPFLIYLIAEKLDVSGILAVFSAGIAHSFARKQLNPETANLNIASESIWEVISFTLDGLVFLILGTQLPSILQTINSGNYSISNFEIIIYILIITFAMTAIRFIWSFITISKKNYEDKDENKKISKAKASLIISLSGARGTVTLASIMSIPILLELQTPFPERDLIILICTGVILCSLVITNFVLPLIIEKKEKESRSLEENIAYAEILQRVVSGLRNQAIPENKIAIEIVIRDYNRRIEAVKNIKQTFTAQNEEEQKLRIMIVEWKKENLNEMLLKEEITSFNAQNYLRILDRKMNRLSGKKNNIPYTIKMVFRQLIVFMKLRKQSNSDLEYQNQFMNIVIINDQFAIDKLKKINKNENNYLIQTMIAHSEMMLSLKKNRFESNKYNEPRATREDIDVKSVISVAFQIERDNIQDMFENGRITRETAKEMRNNIALSEMRFNQDDI